MKNLLPLVTSDDIHAHCLAHWKTEAFRSSHRQGGYVHSIVDQYARLPRFSCETTNDRLERAHFCTWWGLTMRRDDYNAPAIEDLYLLHEIWHAAHMPFIPGIGFEAFHGKMERNELEASVASELLIYFKIEGLRESAFPHPIYADRFLNDPAMRLLWRENEVVATNTLLEARRNVMYSKPEGDMDLSERWIRKFTMQNRQWSIVWADRYLDIEDHMHRFQQMALGGDRKAAADFHADWIQAEAAMDTVDHVPFRDQALLFATIYWANRAKYDAALAVQRASQAKNTAVA
ncbi:MULTISPECIES: hypothetical protein [unclassified Mesorhizobium]|jgi:hypothetical protein|uniref:hypothetical protein n=1 Tax=unclassified Mesorhizobium TaxID=325217 RepID=UPI000FCB7E93|nr:MULTISPECIES: hypothetical protein [unclassified Mesorhizobium]RUX92052.1 hypothetical protein EN993_24795 [Mesorhizobium sp. M7D.F.Ca.US.004.01.2.1]RVA21450.1 hypothetical protein EN935_31780 [Mesorhizobium sp. M7D.F.Ca.US.004.03.1.1]